MKILIFGAGGQVGRELLAHPPGGATIMGLTREQVDITNRRAVFNAIELHKPTTVINAAAYTAVDKAESEIELAFAVNRKAVENLSRSCAFARVPLFHISTDYVFDGKKKASYVETDAPNPQTIYGKSKFEGEEILREIHPLHIILRVSWVFGAHGKNFVRTMLQLARNNKELRVVNDQHGGPTPASSISDVLLDLARRYHRLPSRDFPWGTYHYVGQPTVSWYDFAHAIFEEAVSVGLIQTRPPMIAITTQDFPTPARRPANSTLDTSRIEATFGYSSPNWRKALRKVLLNWKGKA